MVYVLLDTGLCGRTAYFILDRGFRNSVSGFSKRHAYIYIYIFSFILLYGYILVIYPVWVCFSTNNRD